MRSIFRVIFLISTLAFADLSYGASFAEFLQQFEENRKFQQNNITYPLQYSFIDSEAELEPATIHKRLSELEVLAPKEPIYPSPLTQKSIPLMRKIDVLSHTNKTVHLFKPDTSYILMYQFELINGCWKLTKFENLSI